MARAIIKVDARSRASLAEALRAQEDQRRQFGETAYSIFVDNNKRHICYVILDWASLHSLDDFLESSEAKEMLACWPTESIVEVLELYELGEDISIR
jgi:quinol monooxygenase YgiN